MNKISKNLYSKNGLIVSMIAKQFLLIKKGGKIPTVSQIVEQYHFARGTVQNAIQTLVKNKAIILDTRGMLGTFLVSKNNALLFELSQITSIAGVMPLPYSKRYEGLATGLISCLENQFNIPVSLAYMRGAKNRISMLNALRYDFAIISRYAFEQIKKNADIKLHIVKSFGQNSYLSNHVIIFKNNKHTDIKDGMKIGIDHESIDHALLTNNICKGKNVEFVQTKYNQVVNKVISGELDAAIWNEDEIIESKIKIKYTPINYGDRFDTEAVLVVCEDNYFMITLLSEFISEDTVLGIQKEVMNENIYPSY